MLKEWVLLHVKSTVLKKQKHSFLEAAPIPQIVVQFVFLIQNNFIHHVPSPKCIYRPCILMHLEREHFTPADWLSKPVSAAPLLRQVSAAPQASISSTVGFAGHEKINFKTTTTLTVWIQLHEVCSIKRTFWLLLQSQNALNTSQLLTPAFQSLLPCK